MGSDGSTADGGSISTDVLIVGGGLAGLALARRLEAAGVDFRLIEARDRLGGRILSLPANGANPRFDLGPAWFWPGQSRIAQLIRELGLDVFEQWASGRMIYQDANGVIRRDLPGGTMAGSYRIDGGMVAIVNGLAERIDSARVHPGHRLATLTRTERGADASIMTADGAATISARTIVLAVPPRVLASRVVFNPVLSREQTLALTSTPTWMAGHAKIIAVYPTPFWRRAGLSGDAMSRRGPLAEIHDASPASGSPGALFGFVGLPAAARRTLAGELQRRAIAQLVALFGPEAGAPSDVLLKDWSTDGDTAVDLDLNAPGHHPEYGLPPVLSEIWGGHLVLASTEVASTSGGLLEGALEAAAAAFEALPFPSRAD